MKNKIKEIIANFNEETRDRFIRMCWEDRTPFEIISLQFNLSPNEIPKVMQRLLPEARFKAWRERVHKQGQLKNLKIRPKEVNRFKCSRQRMDGTTKGYK